MITTRVKANDCRGAEPTQTISLEPFAGLGSLEIVDSVVSEFDHHSIQRFLTAGTQFLKALLKVSLPTLRKSFHCNGSTQQCRVALISYVQSSDIADPYTASIFFEQLELITGADFTFLQYRQVEASALANQESLNNVSAAKAKAQLVAWHTRLRNHH